MKLFPQIDVLCVRFGPDGEAEFSLDEPKSAPKRPLVVVVSGKGVITKSVSEGASGSIVETVTCDPETFLWTIANGRISFVRREQLAAIAEQLERFRPIVIECAPDTDDATLAGVVERFRTEHLNWRRILKPSVEGSRLAALIARRLQLPVLGALMAILTVNFAFSGRVREGFQQSNMELNALRRSSSAVSASNENRRAVVEQFSRRSPFRASRLSDRIGGAAPDKIALTEVAIAPLQKALEAGKPLQQLENMVVVRGETAASEAITEFTDALGRLRLGTIRLAAVEQDRENETLTFRIEITL